MSINSLMQTAVVTDRPDGTLSIIDLKTLQVTDTINVGGAPVGPAIDEGLNLVAFSDNTAQEVVASFGEGTLSLLS